MSKRAPFRFFSSEEVIAKAIQLVEEKIREYVVDLTSPTLVKDYLRLRTSTLEHEVFGVLFLNSQNHLIECEEMFRGTITQTSVYPREVVKMALKVNASGAIFYHNHPSGAVEPSSADINLTKILKDALQVVDVQVLDHIIVAGTRTYSFAERGIL